METARPEGYPRMEYQLDDDVLAGDTCDKFVYNPTPSDYELIEHRPSGNPVTDSVAGNAVRAFTTEGEHPPFFQLPRSGRVCYTKAPNGKFISVKGDLGPSPGSNSFKSLHERRFRYSRNGKAWVNRIPMTAELGENYFVTFEASGEDPGIKMVNGQHPFMEAHSPFAGLLREAAMSRTWETLGIRSPRASTLMRRTVELPWSSETDAKQAMEQNWRKQNQQVPAGIIVDRDFKPWLTRDTGLLVREFDSAARPQDYYDMAIRGQWGKLGNIADPLRRHSLYMTKQFATAAAMLMNNGIAHNQLNYDRQNITMAGEICDLDGTVILPMFNPELAGQFEDELKRLEDQQGVSLLSQYNEDLVAVAPDEVSGAKTLMEQVWILADDAAFFEDLADRTCSGDAGPGCSISSETVKWVAGRFINQFIGQLTDRGKHITRIACQAHVDILNDFRAIEGCGPYFKYLIEHERHTIFGWDRPDREFNCFIPRITELDLEWISDDYAVIREIIGNELGVEPGGSVPYGRRQDICRAK